MSRILKRTVPRVPSQRLPADVRILSLALLTLPITVLHASISNAYFGYEGKIRAAPAIFGDEGVSLLGATTMEALGMILDPIRRELKPLPMLLM